MSTPNQLSDTPRTDAAWAKTFQDDEDQCRAGNAATDMRDECATLERELAALTAERDQLRAEVKESNERERVAIASWDEDRQRALREGGRVVELRTEVERWELAFQEQYARAESAEREVERLNGCCEELHTIIDNHGYPSGVDYAKMEARASRAEAEVERLGHLEAVLRSSAADMTAGSITAGGVADLRAKNERLRRAYVRPDDIRAQLESANARAVRAEAELASERGRLDYLSTRGFEHRHHETGDHLGYEWTISSYSESEDVTLRDVIDAEMREDEK
jgi:hypothetical protein